MLTQQISWFAVDVNRIFDNLMDNANKMLTSQMLTELIWSRLNLIRNNTDPSRT